MDQPKAIETFRQLEEKWTRYEKAIVGLSCPGDIWVAYESESFPRSAGGKTHQLGICRINGQRRLAWRLTLGGSPENDAIPIVEAGPTVMIEAGQAVAELCNATLKRMNEFIERAEIAVGQLDNFLDQFNGETQTHG